MLSIDLKNGNETNTIVENCRNDGLLLFYFLFNTESIRITPPLTISEKEIKIGCEIILRNLDKL
jgi:acetylornithine/N-succinyldiaminopimelate aminotransferase